MSANKVEASGDDPVIPNAVLDRMNNGEWVAVLSVRLVNTVDIVPIAAASGFDSLYLDLEHSNMSLSEAGQICVTALAAGVGAFVRVPNAAEDVIARVLDGGAMGIIVPQLTTASQVRDVVRAAKLPPLGARSVSSSAPQLRYRSLPVAEANRLLNSVTAVAPMIETLEALEAVDEFVAVPGIDMIFIGANDLSTALGVPGEYGHPLMRAAYDRILTASKKAGVHVGIGGVASDPSVLRDLIDAGVTYVSVGTDLGLLMSGSRSALRILRPPQD
ncbi:MAG: 4-hydroxy-2-oxoheptanedioate aldolase [Actinomycetota bacterium]|jgi:2-keto-3-deoxy-L-rhamnonate aldolase RhmA|nr:4-hydroxy-2-oxoheptanedioate aldolase [Actinomycetota bacterium]